MIGTAHQIERAEEIKMRVNGEFNRVAECLRAVSTRQTEPARSETHVALRILEQKRDEVMANNRAGYFVQQWGEMTDQVRRMIAQDPRHQALREARATRRSEAVGEIGIQ